MKLKAFSIHLTLRIFVIVFVVMFIWNSIVLAQDDDAVTSAEPEPAISFDGAKANPTPTASPNTAAAPVQKSGDASATPTLETASPSPTPASQDPSPPESATNQAAVPTPTPEATASAKIEGKELSPQRRQKQLQTLRSFVMDGKGMRFVPEKNGVKILKPQLSYAVDQDTDLMISGANFNENSFRVIVAPRKSLGVPAEVSLESSSNVLFLTAPLAIGQNGKIEVLNEVGETLFTKPILSENLAMGTSMAKVLTAKFWKDVLREEQVTLLFDASDMAETLLDQQRKSGFRFCWSQTELTYSSRVCSPFYRYSKKENSIKPQTQTNKAVVLINGKSSPLSGTIEADVNSSLSFIAKSSKGFSAEYQIQVRPLLLSDFYLNREKDGIYLIGNTHIPSWPATKIFYAVDPSSFTDLIGWHSTIAAPLDYWVTILPLNQTVVTMPGVGGGIIRYPLEITKAPSENARLKLTNPLPSTYASDTSLRGEKSKKVSVTAPKGVKIKVNKKGDQFLWQFPAPSSGIEQESHLIVKEDDQEFSAFHTMYRGYSSELSFRLAGVLSSELQMNLLTEVAYNQWFETLFGWENALLGKQRWGLSARHLSTIKSFSAQGKNVTDLTVRLTTVDLKYRLTPGLWERDETWGLIVGGEDITINRIRGSFLGAGWFWARSMPRVFDNIFNWFPYMSYPKWVDMEMLYYFVPMNSSVQNGSSPTYAINFHGKIMWTKNFFGEAGFGVKAYSYKVNRDRVTVQALYGTAGLGFNF